MICKRCGTEFAEGIFCPKCGTNNKEMKADTKIPIEDNQSEPKDDNLFVDSAKIQMQGTLGNMTKKATPKKLLIILGVAVLFIIAVVFIAVNWTGKVDYVATVKAHKPFAVSQGLPYTYGEVIGQYFDSLEWKVREEGDVHYVDVSGTEKGTEGELLLTIKVSSNPDDPNGAFIEPVSVTIDRDLELKDSDAVGFLIAMFSAYDESYSDISKLLILMDLLEAKGEIIFSETYTNEDEGISFKYPAPWMPVNEMEDAVENALGITVVGLANTLMPYQSFILVSKFPDNPLKEYLFIDNDEFVANFSDEVSVIETSVGELDGVMAREISYIDSEDRYFQSYFYAVGTDLYRVDLACEEFHKEKFERIFDAIMNGYSVDTLMMTNSDMYVNASETMNSDINSNVPSVDIYFNNIPVSELLNSSTVELVQRFGGSYYANENGGISYDEIEFYMLDDETVGYIWSFSPECFSINGKALNVNDEGFIYSDEIIELLGTDYEDESLSSGYYMTYYYPSYTLSFGVNKFSEVSDIRIYNLAPANSDSFGNVSGVYQEPIENYWKLAGSYSDSMGMLTLRLSIYTSQEEGEIEIGTAEIYANNWQYYLGPIIPMEDNIYKVETDTGEEVLLVEAASDGGVVLQLYVDGQYLDEYQMKEHYES